MISLDEQKLDIPEPLLERVEGDWDKAQEYAAAIGEISPIFRTAIRLIKKGESDYMDSSDAALSSLSTATAAFLIRVSPSLQAIFYYAAVQLHGEELTNIQELNVQNLIPLFSPGELASIIGLASLHRALGRKCDKQEWGLLSKRLCKAVGVGALIGETIEYIGAGNGMLIGGVRYLALALFSLDDLKVFQKYRRQAEQQGHAFDIAEENKIWGCNHLQIASFLLQSMGYGSIPPVGICIEFFQKNVRVSRREEIELECWKHAVHLIESYITSGKAPLDAVVDSETDSLSLPLETAGEIEERVARILNEEISFDWLEKTRGELPPVLKEALTMSIEELIELEAEAAAEAKKKR